MPLISRADKTPLWSIKLLIGMFPTSITPHFTPICSFSLTPVFKAQLFSLFLLILMLTFSIALVYIINLIKRFER